MFVDEIAQRSRTLVEGADAIEMGAADDELAGSMLREGHTIKGTGRVMGYEAVSLAGLMLEDVWRWIHQGAVEPFPALAAALRNLAEALPDAVDDPDLLVDPMLAVHAAFDGVDLPDALPLPLRDDANEATQDADDGDGAVVIPFEPRAAAVAEEPAGGVDDGEEPAVAVEDADRLDEPEDDAVDPEAAAALESLEGLAEIQEEPDEVVDEVDGDVASAAGDRDAEDDDQDAGEEDRAAEDGEEGDADEAAADVVEEPVPSEPEHVAAAVDEPRDVVHHEASGAFLEFSVEAVGPEPRPVIEVDIEHAPVEFDPEWDLDPVPEPAGLAVFDPDDRQDGAPVADVEIAERVAPAHAPDLGGLLGALETWASAESVVVKAGQLYRMINELAGVSLELEAASKRADALVALTSGTTVGEDTAEIAAALRTLVETTRTLEDEALDLASVKLSTVTSTLPQLARYLGKKTGKAVALELVGDDVLVDRQIADRIGEPIRHLVVNAIAHGIELPDVRTERGKPPTGSISVHVAVEEGKLIVEVADDGAGIDWGAVAERAQAEGLAGDDAGEEELRSVLTKDGFSTSPQLDDLAGDGTGLAKVRAVTEELYGTFTIESDPDQGTIVTLTVPTHRALQKALVVRAGRQHWGVPETAVDAVMPLGAAHASVVAGGSKMVWKAKEIPVVLFATLVGTEPSGLPTHLVIVSAPTGAIAVGVEELIGSREVAAKELGPLVSGPDFVTGAALLGGDEVVLLVDAARLAERHSVVEAKPIGPIRSILIVDDSKGVQEVLAAALSSSGFATYTTGSVSEALKVLAVRDIDAIVVDFSMPRADGVALVHMVRGRFGAIPIVMLSGVATDEDRKRAEEAGVDAFFDKADFREGVLAETLRELIERAETAG